HDEYLPAHRHTPTPFSTAGKPLTTSLSAGEHYMQVSKWLGHSTFVLTLTTYADYINEDEQAAPKVGRGMAELAASVTKLQRKAR
ncbi:hypothetical protein PJH48_28215, partial [Mycobacterium kansasii]